MLLAVVKNEIKAKTPNSKHINQNMVKQFMADLNLRLPRRWDVPEIASTIKNRFAASSRRGEGGGRGRNGGEIPSSVKPKAASKCWTRSSRLARVALSEEEVDEV